MLQRLKKKWGVSWGRFVLIFSTFALGGSLCGYLGELIIESFHIPSRAIRIPIYIIIVTFLWPVCVLLISIPLGQFSFFRGYLSNMWQRITRKHQEKK